MAGEKTEKATSRKRSQERKQGNVFQSRDVVLVFSLLVMFTVLQIFAPQILYSVESAIVSFIDKGATINRFTSEMMSEITIEIIVTVVYAVIPLLLISMVATILATAVQTKMLITFNAIKFKLDKLNPINGFKKLFSLHSVVELAKNIVKLAILIGVTYFALRDEILAIPGLIDMPFAQSLAFFGELIMDLVYTLGVIFVFVAIADYFYQRYDYEKKLRMSKDDIKEEYKQTEGDPKIKAKRRQKQTQMAMRRMMQAVPNADVIIRNPTHYAIAISYKAKEHAAPVVIAKGADYLAIKIIETAEEHDIVITENKPLARSLYESVELDHPIPESFYVAVAEVLAFVYNVKKKNFM